MGSISALQETLGMDTPNFFDAAWAPEQINFTFTGNFQGKNDADLSHYLGNGDIDGREYFTGWPKSPFQDQDNFLEGQISDEITEILTPGIPFLIIETESEAVTQSPTSFYESNLAQCIQPYASPSIRGAPDILEALQVETWGYNHLSQISEDTEILGNGTAMQTASKHGQLTPGASPLHEHQGTEWKHLTTAAGNIQTIARQPIIRGRASSNSEAPTITGIESKPVKRSRKSKKKPMTGDQAVVKRKRFLERNRVAADKCRQNRKKWIENLQEKVHNCTAEIAAKNVALQELSLELLQLKSMLRKHSHVCNNEMIGFWARVDTDRISRTTRVDSKEMEVASELLADKSSLQLHGASSQVSSPKSNPE